MSEHILTALAGYITHFIKATHLFGVAILMAIESSCIPLPSEIIMPFAGYVLGGSLGKLMLVATAGAIGCNVGSLPPYWVGAKGGDRKSVV